MFDNFLIFSNSKIKCPIACALTIISKKIRNILSDSSKFTQVSVTEDKQLNFTVNFEKHVIDLLKDLKNRL